MKWGRHGDGRILASRGSHRPIFSVQFKMHNQPTSWKFACSWQVVSPLGMRPSTVLEHNKSKGGVLETHAVTITDKSASKTSFGI
jgi:hypothetical protein